MCILIPIILGLHFQVDFTSELKLQIQVTLRLLNIVYFLWSAYRNQEEFGAMSQFMKTALLTKYSVLHEECKANANLLKDTFMSFPNKKTMHTCMMSLIDKNT